MGVEGRESGGGNFERSFGLRLGWVRWVNRPHGVRGYRNVVKNTSKGDGGGGGVAADETRGRRMGYQFIILQNLSGRHKFIVGVIKTCVLLNGLKNTQISHASGSCDGIRSKRGGTRVDLTTVWGMAGRDSSPLSG